MSTRKTNLDILREDKALAMSKSLPYGVNVFGGGSKGPYTLIVDRLSEKEVQQIAKAVCDALRRSNDEPSS